MKIQFRLLLPITCLGCLIAMIIVSCASKAKMDTIAFARDNSSASDSEKTVRNFKKYKELHVLTQFGSYDDKMEWLNNFLLSSVQNEPVSDSKGKRMCSIFFTTNASGVTYHCQNFDNPESGVLIGSFSAPGKYKSIALTRMTDITYFPPNFDFSELTEMQKTFIPFFAFYPSDGINEYGLSVSIAGSYPHNVTDTKGKKGVFITYLNRLMLDSCKTVEEALRLVNKYYFFDREGLIVTNHLLVADKLGNAAIIEYDKKGKMQYLIKKKENLVMTNDDVIGVDTSQLKCVRFKAICKQLADKPLSTYMDCMNVLYSVANKTLWSLVMDNNTSTGYIALKGQFNHFYRFNFN